MGRRSSTSVGPAAIVALALLGSLTAQTVEPADSYLPVFVESAWGLKPGQTVMWSGAEFEEDSGDFPTFKTTVHVRRGISNRLLIYGTSQLVRFNKGTYTAWGSSNPSVGLQYRVPMPAEGEWALQLKGEFLPAWGGLASPSACFSPGVDISRRLGSVGFHVNGTVTTGATDSRTVWVSEVDRWRVNAGSDWRLKDGSWVILLAWIKAQPIRPKPVETTGEMGVMRRLSSFWTAGCGVGIGLTEKGQDYMLRFGVRYSAE